MPPRAGGYGCLWRPVLLNRPDGTYNPSVDGVHRTFMEFDHAIPARMVEGGAAATPRPALCYTEHPYECQAMAAENDGAVLV